MTDYRVIFIACPGLDEAERIAQVLVEEKLAACVNILPKITSIFWWENKVERTEELLLIVKTKRDRVKRLIDLVKKIHSYRVPEIISLSITEGSKDYLEWVEKAVEY